MSRIMLLLIIPCFVAESVPAWGDQKISFEKQVLPILNEKCIRCHGKKVRQGKLDMRSQSSMLRGGNSGPAYIRGNSKKSLLIELIHFNEMPPKKAEPRVSEKEFLLLKQWIDREQPPPE